MGYLAEVRNSPADRYRLTRDQVKMATAVCAGQAVLDPQLFSALPSRGGEAPIEVDGSTTAIKEMMSAFASAVYSPSYGPASARQRFERSASVIASLNRWNASITEAYKARLRPAAFQRIFFEGGLSHVFIDYFAPANQDLRSRLAAASDFRALRKDPALSFACKQAHPYLLRTPPAHPPSHSGSHVDGARFANTVLHIGERELSIKDADAKAELLANSLPALRRLAFLEMTGANLALATTTNFLWDKKDGLCRKEYLTIDDRRPRIGFNMETVEDQIREALPQVATYPHRGCPVIYQSTPFEGKDTSIFTVMEATLLRLYQTTGALVMPHLRMWL